MRSFPAPCFCIETAGKHARACTKLELSSSQVKDEFVSQRFPYPAWTRVCVLRGGGAVGRVDCDMMSKTAFYSLAKTVCHHIVG